MTRTNPSIKMLLAAMATGVALTAGGVALADAPKQGRHGGHHMFSQLELTDDQREQLRALRQANREAYRDGLREILTPEQAAQLEAARAERRAAWQERREQRGERRGDRRGHRGHRGARDNG